MVNVVNIREIGETCRVVWPATSAATSRGGRIDVAESCQTIMIMQSLKMRH